MARKPAAVLFLHIWIGLFALEFAYGLGSLGDSNFDDLLGRTVVGFGQGIQVAEDLDGVSPSLPAALQDTFPAPTLESPPSGLVEKEGLSKRSSEIYKLQHAFLL